MHGFGSKMAILANFFFWQYRTGKSVLRYSKTKKSPFQAIKTRSSKSRKIDIFPEGLTHRFGPKMAILATFFFFSNIGQENVFYEILQRKNAFVGYKIDNFKKSKKIDISPNGLTNGFGPKMAILATCFFQAIQGRKLSFTIFQNEKTLFQPIKIRSSNSRIINIFLKRLTHRFGPKMTILATVFFSQYITGKCLLQYSTTKKRLSSL